MILIVTITLLISSMLITRFVFDDMPNNDKTTTMKSISIVITTIMIPITIIINITITINIALTITITTINQHT